MLTVQYEGHLLNWEKTIGIHEAMASLYHKSTIATFGCTIVTKQQQMNPGYEECNQDNRHDQLYCITLITFVMYLYNSHTAQFHCILHWNTKKNLVTDQYF